ncbi:hypothetical protein BGZ61DRAFT_478182 [Ilyonectria robusta]|uniref:uncharacterized protein n=1 Tax=Ilyonectria robusta TaxID=1079257 RepID=UPI001E8CEE7D|nr:uncharacterized protein BGZ61DRAFT_478182 [Ilyonectria robusta]KAH8694588.1 hypothetical protein BGZ61DRAFT_478182 [Ilyonectria robusta]
MDQQTLQKYGTLLTDWASTSPRDRDVKFGLLLGPDVTGHSTFTSSLPRKIWSDVTRQISDMAVIHVTSSLKAAEINAALRTDPHRQHLEGTCRDQQLITHSYGSLLKVLRGNTVPFDASTPYDWTCSQLPPVSLFLIDADPDVSAEYFLLLVVIMAWATKVCINRPEVTVRIMMISSLPLHPLVQDLFWIESSYPFAKFNFGSDFDNFEAREVVGISGAASAVLDKVKDSAPELSHRVVCFRSSQVSEGFPQDWEIEHHLSDIARLPGSPPQRRVEILANGLHVPEHFIDSNIVHIVTGGSRKRLIFDRNTNQIVLVNLKISASERHEQLAWASRPDCGNSMVMLYEDTDFLAGANASRTRRTDVAGSQAAGFFSGLAQFSDWPQLLDFRAPDLPPHLCLPNDRHGVFFAVLPLVNYDPRVARFLSESSSTPKITLIKVQLASALTIGFRLLVPVVAANVKAEENRDAANYGLTGPFVGFRTIWLYLGLIKQAIADNRETLGWALDWIAHPTYGMLDNDVLIDLGAIKRFDQLTKELNRVLVSFGVPLLGLPIEDERGSLEADEFLELLWHLLCAFIHQTAVIAEWKDIWMYDLVSHRRLALNEVVQFIDWRGIQH